MKTIGSFLQSILAWGLLGAVVMTLIAPSISRLLISAPVTFGMNCEPAANWSMQALIRSQVIGLLVGVLTALALRAYYKVKQRRQGAKVGSGPSPT